MSIIMRQTSFLLLKSYTLAEGERLINKMSDGGLCRVLKQIDEADWWFVLDWMPGTNSMERWHLS